MTAPIDPVAYANLICLQRVPEPFRTDLERQLPAVIAKAVQAAGGKVAVRRQCRNPLCSITFLVGVNARGVHRSDKVYCSHACKMAFRRASYE